MGQFSNARIYLRQFILSKLKQTDGFQLLFMIQEFKQMGNPHHKDNIFYKRIHEIPNFNE